MMPATEQRAAESRRSDHRRQRRASRRRRFLTKNLDLAAATGVEDARWEPFQLALLDDQGRFRIEDKSRQIAWSWTIAAEAIADALINARDSVFVSINLDEATEKIRYSARIFECLRVAGLPRITTRSTLKIEFSNGARLQSLPARPPRGRARSNVYLDEFAHVQRHKEIYVAALPITSKGGRIRIGSSPFGAQGTFWEIFTQSIQPYPGYKRRLTPWWETYAFSTNPLEARRQADRLTPEEMVEQYGRQRIKEIFRNLILEDFLQEYAGQFVDELASWITWQELRRAQSDDHRWVKAEAREGNVAAAFEAIRELARMIDAGEVEDVLAGGMDVGRTRNTSELYLVGDSTTDALPLRLAITMDNLEFRDQEDIVSAALQLLPVTRLQIDRNGIGHQIAENLQRAFPGRAKGVTFTAPRKTLWATDAKMLIQNQKTPLPVDRDIAYQIHSIRRTNSGSGNMRFDTETSEKHHADKFWAWALAISAGYRQQQREARREAGGKSGSRPIVG